MARKSVQDLSTVGTVEFKNAGQEFSGYYLGYRNVTSDYGVHKLHVFNTPEGNIGAWGTAKLDDLISKVPAGAMTYIAYQGKQKLGGGRTMKKFTVDFDDELTIDISTVAGAGNAALASADEASDEIDSDSEYSDASTEEAAAPAAARTAAKASNTSVTQAHVSKVDSLLAKKA